MSMNDEALAKQTAEEWGLDAFPLGHGLGLADADRWGLFVSAGIKDNEPAHFSEPALFVVRPDGTLYASIVQTMPFARPPLKGLLGTLRWIAENDYPARGESTAHHGAGGAGGA